MAKLGFALLAFLATLPAFLYGVEWGGLELPFLAPQATPPAALASLGTPAPPPEPSAQVAAVFAPPEGRDPLAPDLWRPTSSLLAAMGTPTGWAALCQAFTTATGPDRTVAPLPGALACSSDPSLLPVQRLAALLLDAKAQLALWLRGAPGSSLAAVTARQAAIRTACSLLPETRTPNSPAALACAQALARDLTSQEPDASLAALDGAYATLADFIAARDPTTAAEPAFPDTP